MADIGKTIVDACRAAMGADVTVDIRYAGDNDDLNGTVEDAMCTGVEALRAITEQGIYAGKDGTVRYAKEDEPTAWATNQAILGQVVEVQLPGETEWSKLRVSHRLVIAGAVRLTVTGEFDEV